jgi:hypothetical protein
MMPHAVAKDYKGEKPQLRCQLPLRLCRQQQRTLPAAGSSRTMSSTNLIWCSPPPVLPLCTAPQMTLVDGIWTPDYNKICGSEVPFESARPCPTCHTDGSLPTYTCEPCIARMEGLFSQRFLRTSHGIFSNICDKCALDIRLLDPNNRLKPVLRIPLSDSVTLTRHEDCECSKDLDGFFTKGYCYACAGGILSARHFKALRKYNEQPALRDGTDQEPLSVDGWVCRCGTIFVDDQDGRERENASICLVCSRYKTRYPKVEISTDSRSSLVLEESSRTTTWRGSRPGHTTRPMKTRRLVNRTAPEILDTTPSCSVNNSLKCSSSAAFAPPIGTKRKCFVPMTRPPVEFRHVPRSQPSTSRHKSQINVGPEKEIMNMNDLKL